MPLYGRAGFLYLPRWYAISGGIEEISQINGLISELDKLKGAAQ